jgi:hypothetical protein
MYMTASKVSKGEARDATISICSWIVWDPISKHAFWCPAEIKVLRGVGQPGEIAEQDNADNQWHGGDDTSPNICIA